MPALRASGALRAAQPRLQEQMRSATASSAVSVRSRLRLHVTVLPVLSRAELLMHTVCTQFANPCPCAVCFCQVPAMVASNAPACVVVLVSTQHT
jgi:hypothetical protein